VGADALGAATLPLASLAATGTGPLAGPLAATGTGPLAGPLALATGTAPEAVVGAPAGAVAPWPRRDASGGRRRAHEAQ
jgi:hypothetical protein